MNPRDFDEYFSASPGAVQNPQVTLAAANQRVPADILNEVLGMSDSHVARRYLESQETGRQAWVFSRMTEEQQNSLRAVGYKTTAEKQDEKVSGVKRWLSAAKDVAGSAWNSAADKVDAGLGWTLDNPVTSQAFAQTKFVFNNATWFAEQGDQALRAAEYAVVNEGDIFGVHPLVASLKYWDEVEDGETVFHQKKITELEAATEDKLLFQLALQQATGKVEPIKELLEQHMANGNAQGYAEIAGRLDSSLFKDLVDKMNDMKLSVGRATARALQIDEGSDTFNTVSGGVDAVKVIAIDPFTYVMPGGSAIGVGGKVGRGALKSKDLTDSAALARRLDVVYGKPDVAPKNRAQDTARKSMDSVGQRLDNIRNGVNAGDNYALVLRENPMLTPPMVESMLQGGVRDWVTFRDFAETTAGQLAIGLGNPAARIRTLPYRRTQGAWARKKERLNKPLIWNDEAITHRALVDEAMPLVGRIGSLTDEENKLLNEAISAASKGVDDSRVDAIMAKSGKLKKRFQARIPVADKDGNLALTGRHGVENMERIALMFMPERMAKELAARFAATSDVNVRYDMVKGAVAQGLEALGLKSTPEGDEIAKRFLRDFDAANGRVGRYTVTEVLDYQGRAVPILKSHMRQHVGRIDFAELAVAMAKAKHAAKLGQLSGHQFADIVTGKVFKPIVLIRPALAFRNAADGTLNLSLKEGVPFMGKGFFAHAAVKNLEMKAMKANPKLRDQIDPSKFKTVRDAIIGHTFGALSAKALAKIDDEGILALRLFAETPVGRAAVGGRLSNGSARTLAGDIDAGQHGRAFGHQRINNMTVERLNTVNTGRNVLSMSSDDNLAAWAGMIDTHAADDIGKHSIIYANDPNRAFEETFQAIMNDPEYVSMARAAMDPSLSKEEAIRVLAMKVVAEGQALFIGIDGTFNQRLWRNVVTETGAVKKVEIDDLKGIEPNARIAEAISPGVAMQWSKHGTGAGDLLNLLANASFQKLGEIEAMLVRHPQYNSHLIDSFKALGAWRSTRATEIAAARQRVAYAAGGKADGPVSPEFLELWAKAAQSQSKSLGWSSKYVVRAADDSFDQYGLVPAGGNLPAVLKEAETFRPKSYKKSPTEQANDEALELAMQDAFERTMMNVDNPARISQLAVMMRNFAPFYRAQEDFTRRWLQVAKYSPKAMWRAQVIWEGAHDAGLVYEDENGNKVFTYPFSSQFAGLLNRTLHSMGLPEDVKVPTAIGGKVQGLAPGYTLDDNVHPLSGVLLTVPVQTAARLGFEPAKDAERWLFSRHAQGKGPLDFLTPTWLDIAGGLKNEKLDAARLSVAANFQAGGYPYPQNGTAEQQQKWRNDIDTQAKVKALFTAASGAFLPAFPRAEDLDQQSKAAEILGNVGLKVEFLQLQDAFGRDKAIDVWQQLYPDKLPFVASTKEYAAGVPMPVSAESFEFMKEHESFLRRNADVAALFVPVKEGEFSRDAWNFASSIGAVESKDLDDYISDISLLAVENEYYQVKRAIDAQRAEYKARGRRDLVQKIDQDWQVYQDEQYAANPLLAAKHAAGGQVTNEKRQRLARLREGLRDNELPATEEVEKLRMIVAEWDLYQAIRGQYTTQSAYDIAQRREAKENFEAWMNENGADTTFSRAWNSIFSNLD